MIAACLLQVFDHSFANRTAWLRARQHAHVGAPPSQQWFRHIAAPIEASHEAFAFSTMAPTTQDASGEIRIVDSTAFKISKTIAMAHVPVKPGAMRELHWHTNAAEWQYNIAGKGRMTVFANKSDSRTMDFAAGDVGYVPQTPHYIENTGDVDLVFLEMFKAPTYNDVSLNNWLAAVPAELLAQHLSLDPKLIAGFPKRNVGVLGL